MSARILNGSGRAPAVLAAIVLAIALSGCGSSSVQSNPTSLEKPALTVPQGSLAASTSTKKSGSTGTTSSTTDSSSDTTDSGTGTDTGAGTDTGGADNGTGTGTGTATGGADTGGAGPGN